MIALIGIVAVSFLLIGLYRWIALHYRWLDHPNHRSSHSAVTPRGAGAVFALCIIGVAAASSTIPFVALASLSTGLGVMLTGWWDDLRGVPSTTRFALYMVLSGIAAAITLPWDGAPLILACTAILVTLWLAWSINLFNFMDGINGLVTLETIFVLLAINFLADGTRYEATFSELHILAGAVLVGFLLWNFPAGKVFMGDAGSAFLGFLIGLLALQSHLMGGPSPAVWAVLLAVFIADTGYTLIVRIATRQRWYAAHRLHAYQRLTNRLSGSHAGAIFWIMALNLCWLLPLAYMVQIESLSWPSGLILAYLPLLAIGFYLKAGVPEGDRV